MRFSDHPLYQEDVRAVAAGILDWGRLQNGALVLSGATGLIGSFLIEVIRYRNRAEGLNCSIHAIGRSRDKARARIAAFGEDFFHFIEHDINLPFMGQNLPPDAVFLHLASNTHPLAYATDPIGTITTNILGAHNLLECAVRTHASRFVFASSNEVYGENRGDMELFSEDYCGYIDCNTLRAGYPESKRCAEALCQAYSRQHRLDVVIPRLTRSFGPGILDTDTKALSQFLHKAVKEEDIVLKSKGEQFYSYTYVADAVSGLLTALLRGQSGHAYNIADESGDVQLRDLASMVARHVGRKVVFEIPDELEQSGYSRASKARLDGTKLRSLGWKPLYGIREAICRTIDVMRVCA